MPIEIKELTVKLTVDKQSTIENEKFSTKLDPLNRRSIIDECVDKVLMILENRFDR